MKRAVEILLYTFGVAAVVFFSLGVILFDLVSVAEELVRPKEKGNITTFVECVAAGNPVAESYPRQCRHGGKTFVEEVGDNGDGSDIIRVFEPRLGSVISSPLTVKGEARGTWYFEASFPVRLLDNDGNEVAVVPAQAQGDPATGEVNWMTEEFVPFTAVLDFKYPLSSAGTLVLEKDNPSGLAENADERRIPVQFASPPSLQVY